VQHISENKYEQVFEYWPNYDRVKSTLSYLGATQETKYYFGEFEIQQDAGGKTTHLHYIDGADGVCAIVVIDPTNTTSTKYVYKDNLGSFTTITDDAGTIIAKQNL
jgi:hypothetical protein